MNSRDQLKRDIARLVLHPRFGCLRAYCGDDWECEVTKLKNPAQVECISGSPLGVCVSEALKYLRKR